MSETATRLTAEEAQIAGKIPTGHVWDEETQQPVPRGSVPVPMDHFVGTSMAAEEFKARRNALLGFVKHQLTEATYDGRGYPVKVNDYYQLPGWKQKRLSRKGAELLGDLYKYKIQYMEEVGSTVEKDFCSATYRCTLHRSGVVVACREASVNTSEASFQAQMKKYGGDARAAENDVRGKSQTRAYINAMIAACAASDIFAVADEQEIAEGEWEEIKGDTEEATVDPRVALIERLLQTVNGHEAFDEKERAKLRTWANRKKRTVEELEETMTLVEDRILQWEESHETHPLKK